MFEACCARPRASLTRAMNGIGHESFRTWRRSEVERVAGRSFATVQDGLSPVAAAAASRGAPVGPLGPEGWAQAVPSAGSRCQREPARPRAGDGPVVRIELGAPLHA